MMNETELSQIVTSMEANSVGTGDSFIPDNKNAFDYYMGAPFGDEEDNRSKVVSTDVADVVEADMPSLARVFLGAGKPVEFMPTSENELDAEEARQKNVYIPYLIDNCRNSFKKQYDWLKCIEIYKAGVLEYGRETKKISRVEAYEGLDELELAAYLQEFDDDKNVKETKITSQKVSKKGGVERFDIEVSLIGEESNYFLRNVPIEDLILTKGVQTKEDADIVGKRWTKTRGALVEDGFDKAVVKKLTKSSDTQHKDMKDQRTRSEDGVTAGGQLTSANSEVHWTMEYVSGTDVYVLVDYNEDGIRERRHVIKSGTTILLNEDFNHIPYVITSAIQMPHVMIGRSRAEITMPTQRLQSVLERGVCDNVYMVNAGRNVISQNINYDDLLAVRTNGVVRSKGTGPIGNDILPLITPYVGDKTLQVIQYFDSKRAQTTGSLMANQGLEANDLYKETATRFKGVEHASKAKIELLARVIAEAGYMQLYEGMAWFARHYQKDEQEIYVMGQTLLVNPAKWKYEHKLTAEVGTGAGDDEQMIENRSALLSVLEQLKARGSVLVDEKKVYNQIARIAKSMGIKDLSTVINDPERPEQVLQAENEILTQMVEQLQQQVQSNPLAEAEMIKAQATLVTAQSKGTNDMQQFIMKLAQDSEQFKTLSAQERAELAKDLTELELKYRSDVPGALV